MDYLEDLKILKDKIVDLPAYWDGKKAVLELKEADYNWRQMEWFGFYFEFKAMQVLKDAFQIPGDNYNRTRFDLKRNINWDLKASAINSSNHRVILNDVASMDYSLSQHGFHGEIIALCDVEYNDEDRSFQEWHTSLKGGKSSYEKEREKRTAVSRYRKTSSWLEEVLLLVFTPETIGEVGIHRQGRNSNGAPRPPKYMVDLSNLDPFIVETIPIRNRKDRNGT